MRISKVAYSYDAGLEKVLYRSPSFQVFHSLPEIARFQLRNSTFDFPSVLLPRSRPAREEGYLCFRPLPAAAAQRRPKPLSLSVRPLSVRRSRAHLAIVIWITRIPAAPPPLRLSVTERASEDCDHLAIVVVSGCDTDNNNLGSGEQQFANMGRMPHG